MLNWNSLKLSRLYDMDECKAIRTFESSKYVIRLFSGTPSVETETDSTLRSSDKEKSLGL